MLLVVVLVLLTIQTSSCYRIGDSSRSSNLKSIKATHDDHLHTILDTAPSSSTTTIVSSPATAAKTTTTTKKKMATNSNSHIIDRFLADDEEKTCVVGDGTNQYVFQHGESLGNLFETRCSESSSSDSGGSGTTTTTTTNFPCYCNVNKYPVSIECPYCAFNTNEIETYQDDGLPVNKVVCAKHSETIEFINADNIAQSCSCHIPQDGISPPITTCETIAPPNQCTLELSDGTIKYFQRDESYGDYLPTRCNSKSSGTGSGGNNNDNDFPCYCDPDIPSQIFCPYCPLLDYTQVVVGAGTNDESAQQQQLICARQGETIEIIDETLSDKYLCSCEFNDLQFVENNKGEPMKTNCIKVTPEPTLSPTQTPTRSDTPSITEGGGNGSIPSPPPAVATMTDTPTPQPTKVTTLSPTPAPISILPPPTPEFDINDRGCFINNIQEGGGNTLEFVKAGNSFGNLVSGPCGPSDMWPTYCNPDLPGGTTQEYPYCIFVAAKDELSFSSAQGSSSGGSSAVTTRNSETIGTNPLDNDGIGFGGDGNNPLSRSGREIVCARDGEEVTFKSALTGEIQTCSCFYFSSSLGSLSSCQQDTDFIDDDGKDGDTLAPTTSPISSINPNSAGIASTRLSRMVMSLSIMVIVLVVRPF